MDRQDIQVARFLISLSTDQEKDEFAFPTYLDIPTHGMLAEAGVIRVIIIKELRLAGRGGACL